MFTVSELCHSKLMRYVDFENWWTNILKNRFNKLIDHSTRESMTLSKRKYLERVTIEDLLQYLTERGFIFKIESPSIYNDKWEIKLSNLSKDKIYRPFLTVRSKQSLLDLVAHATLQYLELSLRYN